jgi:hypothetical protein
MGHKLYGRANGYSSYSTELPTDEQDHDTRASHLIDEEEDDEEQELRKALRLSIRLHEEYETAAEDARRALRFQKNALQKIETDRERARMNHTRRAEGAKVRDTLDTAMHGKAHEQAMRAARQMGGFITKLAETDLERCYSTGLDKLRESGYNSYFSSERLNDFIQDYDRKYRRGDCW